MRYDDTDELPWPEMTRREAENDMRDFKPMPPTPEQADEIRQVFEEIFGPQLQKP